MKLPDGWSRAQAVFDEGSLVLCAGLVPVMALAEQAGLSELVRGKVAVQARSVASAGVNPAGKITSIVAGTAAWADSIDDLGMIRSGGMPRVFGEVHAPATVGQLLREFTHGMVCSWRRSHGRTWPTSCSGADCCPTSPRGHMWTSIRCCGRSTATSSRASASATPRSGKQVLRRGLSPLATTISTEQVTGGWPQATRSAWP